MASQTVNFLPPSYIENFTTGFQSSLNSLSGSVSVLNQINTTQTIATGSFTAVKNNTYQYLLPVRYATVTNVVCSLPTSPVNGDFVELIDSPIVLQGWGNTFYSCRVVAATGAVIKGDCAYFGFSANAFGDLYNYRGMTVKFVYNASLNTWFGSAKGNTVTKADDPFTGWWERMTKQMTLSMIKGVYHYIDATRYPITFSTFEGTNKETFMKNVVNSNTFFEYSGASAENAYGKVLAQIANSAILPTGPNSTWTSSNIATINFVGASFDYISLARVNGLEALTSFLKPAYPLNILRRISGPPGQGSDRNLPLDFHQIDIAGGEFLNQSLYDPVYMFKKIMSEADKQQAHLNSNITSYAPDYYVRKQYIDDLCSSQGVTFSVPVAMVRKSIVFTGANLYPSYNPGYTGGSTRLTDIHCAYSQYAGPGSNVTLSGFDNSWTGMNGYYPNGVSVFAWQTNKENAGRLDFKYNNTLSYNAYKDTKIFTGSSTGSALSYLNRFMLIKDSSDPSSYLAETTGPYKGFGVNIGSPVVSVTHRLYSAMPPNEWLAAFVSSCKYLYNNGVHMSPLTYWNTVQGAVVTDWAQLSLPAPTTLAQRLRPKGGEFDCITPFAKSFFSTFYGVGTQISSLNIQQGLVNDPYQSMDWFNNTVIANNNAATLTDWLMLPMLNYCETGTVKNLYYAYAGNAPTGIVQNFMCSQNPTLRNLNNPSITGGSTIVGGLFDYRLPPQIVTGAYKEIYTNPVAPTGTIWTLGDAGTNTNNFVIGKIRNELVGGKTVMYIRMSDYQSWLGTSLGTNLKQFAPQGYTGPSDLVNNIYFGVYAAVEQCISVIGKYFNSFTGSTGAMGPDAVIFDQRGNGGGDPSREILMCFGSDRWNQISDTNFIDDGYSAKSLKQYNSTGANAYWSPQTGGAGGRTYTSVGNASNQQFEYNKQIRPSQMELNFGPSVPYIINGISYTGASPVIKNCNVICLTNEAAGSAAEWFPACFFGDNADRNLGAGCKTNIIGERTPGNYGAQPGASAITRPTNSRRFNLSSFPSYNFDWALSAVFTVPSGPLAGYVTAEEIPSWNYNNALTGPNALTGSAVNTAIKNDISIPLYDFGFLTPDNPNYYISQSRPAPTKSDARTWRDSWLEQALKQGQYM